MAETTSKSLATPRNIIAVLLALGLLAFVVQNTNRVDLNWLFFGFSAPLWLMIAGVGIVGFVIGWFVGRPGKTG